MANTNKQQVSSSSPIARISTPKPVLERALAVLSNDVQNILVVIGQSKLTLPESLHEEYDRIYAIYQERYNELEQIAKGLAPIPPDLHVEPLHASYKPNMDEIYPYAHVFGYVYFQRQIKQVIAGSLEMLALPQGKTTDELGVLSFRIQYCTYQEVMQLKEKYPQYIIDVAIPEKLPRSKKGANAVKERGARINPNNKVKRTIVAPRADTPVYSNQETVRKASEEEMAMLAIAKQAHEENGLKDL